MVVKRKKSTVKRKKVSTELAGKKRLMKIRMSRVRASKAGVIIPNK